MEARVMEKTVYHGGGPTTRSGPRTANISHLAAKRSRSGERLEVDPQMNQCFSWVPVVLCIRFYASGALFRVHDRRNSYERQRLSAGALQVRTAARLITGNRQPKAYATATLIWAMDMALLI